MKKIVGITFLILVSSQLFSQIFESQLAVGNAAYTGMQDERFGDASLFFIPIGSKTGLAHFNLNYQQNLENSNSGIGLSTGHGFLYTDSERASVGMTSVRYRYALNFENNLRIAMGIRASHLYLTRTGFDENQREHKLGFGFGTMMSYRAFTFGVTSANALAPLVNWGLNGSYSSELTEKIALTTIWSSYFGSDNQNHILRFRTEFNQKFWFATGVNYFYEADNDNTNKLYYGLDLGMRIKNNFHLYLGTDFHLSRHSYGILNPKIGFIYQL